MFSLENIFIRRWDEFNADIHGKAEKSQSTLRAGIPLKTRDLMASKFRRLGRFERISHANPNENLTSTPLVIYIIVFFFF